MKGYELRIKCCLLSDILYRDVYCKLGRFINFSMENNVHLRDLHSSNGLKGYSFSSLYPLERDKYREGDIYSFSIRSISVETIQSFREALIDLENEDFLVMDVEYKKINVYSEIENIVTVTPTVITIPKGNKSSSWVYDDGLDVFKRAISNNLCRKYNYINGTNLRVSCDDIIESISITNKYPIAISYKSSSGSILGYKLIINFKKNKIAQDFAAVGLFLGICSKNSSLGCGFAKATYRGK